MGNVASAAKTWIAASYVIPKLAKNSVPSLDGELFLDGMQKGGEIIRDKFGIPHIYGECEHDTYFLQGFVHAQDRLWQMETLRRLGAGRISEFRGAGAIPADRYARLCGWYRLAATDVAKLREGVEGSDEWQTVRMLEAYAAGVNAFLAQGNTLPMEFKLAKVTPEPWCVTDSMVIARVLAWQLSYGYQSALVKQLLHDLLGAATAEEWCGWSDVWGNPPALPERAENNSEPLKQGDRINVSEGVMERLTVGPQTRGQTTFGTPLPTTPTASSSSSSSSNNKDTSTDTVSSSDVAVEVDAAAADTSAAATTAAASSALRSGAVDAELPTRGVGSNWWVLSSALAENGSPILAADPHLPVAVPCIWHESHLVDRSKCTGIVPAGVPGVLFGHNRWIGQAVTLAFCDVEDVYVERLVHPPPQDRGASPQEVEAARAKRQGGGGAAAAAAAAAAGVPVVQYEHAGEVKDAEVEVEVIEVKGAAAVAVSVVRTVHGPIISQDSLDMQPIVDDFLATKQQQEKDQQEGNEKRHIHISYCAVSLRPEAATGVALALYGLGRCRDFTGFSTIMNNIETPSLNIAYADVHGNVGYRMTGNVPRRPFPRGEESRLLPGHTGSHDWVGLGKRGGEGDIRGDEKPFALNPAQGFVVSANSMVALEDGEEPYLGRLWKAGFRTRAVYQHILRRAGVLKGDERVGEQQQLQQQQGVFSVDDCVRMLNDVFSPHAVEFVARLRSLSFGGGSNNNEEEEQSTPAAAAAAAAARASPSDAAAAEEVRALLLEGGWEVGDLSATSVGAAVYEVLSSFLQRYMCDAMVASAVEAGSSCRPEIVGGHLAGNGFQDKLKKMTAVQGRVHNNLLMALDSDDSAVLRLAAARVLVEPPVADSSSSSSSDNSSGYAVLRLRLLNRCAAHTLQYLQKWLGPERRQWTWGRLHTCSFKHPIGEALNSPLLDIPSGGRKWELGGDTDTIAQTMSKGAGPTLEGGGGEFEVNGSVASFRQVLDTSDWSRCTAVLPGGQSGQYLSAHYDDQAELWANGKQRPMLWTRDQVEAHATHTLTATASANVHVALTEAEEAASTSTRSRMPCF